MKGCFKTCYKRPWEFEGKELRFRDHVFISKQDIAKVIRLDDIKHIFERHVFDSNTFDDRHSNLMFTHLVSYIRGHQTACASCDECHEAIFPLYYVKTRPNGRKYLIHPDEREHMERYLAGTDDALYDFVHHLKYLPTAQISEVARAAQDFEEKRRKLE